MTGQRWLGGLHLDQRGGRIVAHEGRAATQEVVEEGAETIDIAGHADLAALARRLFRGNVAGRAEHLARKGQVRSPKSKVRSGGQPLGQAEVGDAGLVERIDENIRRLEVAVEDAALVGVVDGFGDELQVAGRAPRCQRLVPHHARQVGACDVVH